MRSSIVAWGMLFAVAQGAGAQSLAPCPGASFGPRAECGTLPVWENRATQSGRKIDLRYVVLRAARPSGREPVFLFAGGPGEAGTGLASGANGPMAPVREIRDIILIDQRGTGGSNPLSCPSDIIVHPELAFGHIFDPALFRKCKADLAQRAELSLYTTEIAAEDVDELRASLGAARVILWGGSYGTRLAQAYMRAHPANVVAAVLDGVVPFDFRAPLDYAANTQQSLDRLFADCRASAGCSADNPGLPAAFGRLLARVRAGPVAVTVRRSDGREVPAQLSAGDFAYAVRGLLYSTDNSRKLPVMMRRADSTDDLSPFAQAYWLRAAAISGLALGMHLAVYCGEDTRFITDGEAAKAGEGTFTGRYIMDEYRNACRDWAPAPVGAHARDPVTAPIPTLLISGWFDPVTPSAVAERVAASLPNHRHLIIRTSGHGSGGGCALPATLHVLVTGTLEGLPAVCPQARSLWE